MQQARRREGACIPSLLIRIIEAGQILAVRRVEQIGPRGDRGEINTFATVIKCRLEGIGVVNQRSMDSRSGSERFSFKESSTRRCSWMWSIVRTFPPSSAVIWMKRTLDSLPKDAVTRSATSFDGPSGAKSARSVWNSGGSEMMEPTKLMVKSAEMIRIEATRSRSVRGPRSHPPARFREFGPVHKHRGEDAPHQHRP